MKLKHAATLVLAGLFALTGLVGCGGAKTSAVKGSLQLNGKPYKLAKWEQIQLYFISEAGVTTPAALDTATGTFTVQLSPGKHKVAVNSIIYPEVQPGSKALSSSQTMTDRYQGRFDVGYTPLTYEVVAGDQEIGIDLGKATVNRK
jgi:hypothetical protein